MLVFIWVWDIFYVTAKENKCICKGGHQHDWCGSKMYAPSTYFGTNKFLSAFDIYFQKICMFTQS